MDSNNSLEYDPAVIARYVHYYKTGKDINTDAKPTNPSIDDNDSTAVQPPPKKKKRVKKKNMDPNVLETRITIQLCCRDRNLKLALSTLHKALRELIRIEAGTFYQLLNLCEGTFAERANSVHVGTPKCKGNDAGKAGDGGKEVDSDDKSRNAGKVEGNNGESHATDKEGSDDTSTKLDGSDAAAKGEKNTEVDNNPATATEDDANLNVDVTSLKQRLHHAHQIHSLLSSLDVPCIEQAYTALIRLAARANDFESAEEYLTQAEKTPQCKIKLRMYSCLLRAYCGELTFSNDDGGGKDNEESAGETTVDDGTAITQERLVKALKVWKRMYDNSGGLSTGHPNYAIIKNNNESKDDTSQLFGEGISPKISLTELEYSALMTCATKLGDAPVMERAFGDVADEVLVPGSNTTDIVLDWFRSNVKGNKSSTSALDHVTLPPREDPSPLGAVTNGNGKGWNIYRGCTIDVITGKLTLGALEQSKSDDGNATPAMNNAKAQYRLKPVDLSDRAWNAMCDMNKSIVLEGEVKGNVSKFQGGGKGKKRARGGNGNNNNPHCNNNNNHRPNNNNNNNNNPNKSQWRINGWKNFEKFIQDHPPYDMVIDGANVGYYEQNFANSPKHVDYKQIDWVVRHLLESDGGTHRIVLFLHERHFSPRLAPDWAFSLFRAWDSREDRPAYDYRRLTVYRTPGGMNDDWYWMHAALVNGARKKDEGGSTSSSSVLAITNDEMRDHHFQMSAQGSFLRWKERHQVHFDFGAWNRDLRRRDVLLTYPKSYSRRIQRVDCCNDDDDGGDGGDGGGEAIVIPLPKRGDEGRFADGTHVAEEGVPEEETYVVIQRVI